MSPPEQITQPEEEPEEEPLDDPEDEPPEEEEPLDDPEEEPPEEEEATQVNSASLHIPPVGESQQAGLIPEPKQTG